MHDRRPDDIKRFYGLMDRLVQKLGRPHTLSECNGRMQWPERGVYFFFEDGEQRLQSESVLRVVRVGTHAIQEGARTSLWGRLRQHKGCEIHGGGNHRGSVFRKLIGQALIDKNEDSSCPTWGVGANAPREVRDAEHPMECLVSAYIRKMPFAWLEADDQPGPNSVRATIEQHSIGLLSNYHIPVNARIDQASGSWLGRHSLCKRVRESGLWNSDHVDAGYDTEFLDLLESLIEQMPALTPAKQ